MVEYTRLLEAIIENRQETISLIRCHRKKTFVLNALCDPRSDILTTTNAIPTELLHLADNHTVHPNLLAPNALLIDLEKSITELEGTCHRLQKAKEKIMTLPTSFSLGEMQLIDIGKMFPANFFRKNIDKLWARHRLCPSPTKIGDDIRSLDYHLNDLENNTAIYMSRSNLLTNMEGLIKEYSANLNEKKSEKYSTTERLKNSLITRYRNDTHDLYTKTLSLGIARRHLKRKRNETSLAIKTCETELATARCSNYTS